MSSTFSIQIRLSLTNFLSFSLQVSINGATISAGQNQDYFKSKGCNSPLNGARSVENPPRFRDCKLFSTIGVLKHASGRARMFVTRSDEIRFDGAFSTFLGYRPCGSTATRRYALSWATCNNSAMSSPSSRTDVSAYILVCVRMCTFIYTPAGEAYQRCPTRYRMPRPRRDLLQNTLFTIRRTRPLSVHALIYIFRRKEKKTEKKTITMGPRPRARHTVGPSRRRHSIV